MGALTPTFGELVENVLTIKKKKKRTGKELLNT